jgi:hypothetical protein
VMVLIFQYPLSLKISGIIEAHFYSELFLFWCTKRFCHVIGYLLGCWYLFNLDFSVLNSISNEVVCKVYVLGSGI